MIERYDNAIQIAVLAVCVVFAAYRAVTNRSRSWTMLSLFFGSWFLGDIYWLVCLLFYGSTPQISVICDLSWYASYVFLYLFLRHISPPEEFGRGSRVLLLVPVFSFGMAVFFMFRGEILSNLICAGLMGLLLYSSIHRLTLKDKNGRYRFLPALVLVFCLLEYALWTASCFWNDDLLIHPYYVFDFLLTVSFPFFLLAAKKAVKT